MPDPIAKFMRMRIDASGNISFDPSGAFFKVRVQPQILRIDTSILRTHPHLSIVKLKLVNIANAKHIQSVLVEDGNADMHEVKFDTPFPAGIGRIDSILILFKMPKVGKTGPFGFHVTVRDQTKAPALADADYDPQVGNDPPAL